MSSLLLLLVVVASTALTARPSGAASTTPPTPPLALRLDRFDAGSPPVVGEPIILLAHGVADTGMKMVELWADDGLVDTAQASDSGRVAVAVLEWTPTKTGRTRVVARGIDDADSMAHSTALSFDVAAGREGPLADPKILSPAEEAKIGAQEAIAPLQGLAKRLGIGDVAAVNLRAPTPEPHRGHADVPTPQLRVNVAACDANATVGGTAGTGIALYHLAPGGRKFSLVGSAQQSGSFKRMVGGGTHLFYAAAFRENRISFSSIEKAPAAAGCTTSRWTGTVSIIDGKLRAPTTPKRAYLKIRVDGGREQRVPADTEAFVDAVNGVLDFSEVFPPVNGNAMSVKAIEVNESEEISLGEGSVDAGGGSLIDLIGAYGRTGLRLVRLHSPDPDSKDPPTEVLKDWENLAMWQPEPNGGLLIPPFHAPQGTNTFRWTPTVPFTTHGIYQVVASYPGHTPTLWPPGLLATGVIPAGQSDFNIDLKKILTPDSSSGSGGSGSSGAGSGSNAKTMDISYSSVKYDAASPTSNVVVQPESAGWVFETKPAAIYVRMVPMAGNEPLEAVSDPVTFSLEWSDPSPPTPPPPTPSGPAFERKGILQRPFLPNDKYRDCVRVVDNPNLANFNPFFGTYWNGYKFLNEGDTVCPIYSSGGNDEGFDIGDINPVNILGGLAEFWDAMANAYSYIKGEVISAIVDISGCEAYLSESDCEAVVGFAVDATLMFFGIPPSLPQSKDLLAAAKGDIAEAIIVYGESVGIDCETFREQCKQAVEKALGEIQKHIEKNVSDGAKAEAQSGGGLLPIWHNIRVMPEPTGQLQPLVARVEFKRLSAPLPTGGCTAYADIWGYISEGWKEHGEFVARKAASGQPLTGPAIDLSGLAPGQVREVFLIRHIPTVWWESEHYSQDELYKEKGSSHWHTLMRNPWIQGTTRNEISVRSPKGASCFTSHVIEYYPGKYGTAEPPHVAGP